jgi:hypothetical protein
MRTCIQNLRASARLKTITGPASTEGKLTVTPLARSLTIGRAGQGGFVYTWAWPSAVLVSEDGRTARIPIVNATRLAQVAIVLAAMLLLNGMWARTRTHTKTRTLARTRKERS